MHECYSICATKAALYRENSQRALLRSLRSIHSAMKKALLQNRSDLNATPNACLNVLRAFVAMRCSPSVNAIHRRSR